MFDHSTPPAAGSKGTVPMTAFVGGKKVERARPKGKIVGKDQPRDYFQQIFPIPDGRILVGYRGRYIDSPFGLQIRGGHDLAVQAELPGAAGPFSLRDRKLLASGPLCGGYQSSVRVVDLDTLSILDTFPVCRPYLWLDGRFVGQTPSFPSFEKKPHVDPSLLKRHPSLRPWVENDHGHKLLLLGRSGAVENALDAALVGPEYPVFKHLSLSPDGKTLYACTERSVAAVSLSDWSIRWRSQLGDNTGPRFFTAYAMALDGDGHLAVGGLAGHAKMLVVLDARTGKALTIGKGLGRLRGNTSIRSLAWHPTGWLAVGTASGRVAHVDADGHIRTYKGASKGVESLAFIEGGRSLLVCGPERQLRIWPLLKDEAEGSP
jgi:WD40 repeat protein